MSLILDDKEHELSVEELLLKLISRINILIMHHEKINGEIFTEEDIEE